MHTHTRWVVMQQRLADDSAIGESGPKARICNLNISECECPTGGRGEVPHCNLFVSTFFFFPKFNFLLSFASLKIVPAAVISIEKTRPAPLLIQGQEQKEGKTSK